MRNAILLIFSILFYVACDDVPHRLNGMWQLKSTTDDSGNTVSVDSVYYSFQKEEVFTYTHRHSSEYSSMYYGYLDFPSENEVMISIDAELMETLAPSSMEMFLPLSGWDDYIEIFKIKEVKGSKLILFSESRKKLYTFKKF